MQTLNHYKNLQSNKGLIDDLGCTLPTLSSALLLSESIFCNIEELKNKLNDWQNASGWYQTSNSTAIGMPENIDRLIEGEWYNGKASLSVRLTGPNCYQVTILEKSNTEDTDVNNMYCYQEQDIWLRTDLKEGNKENAATYRQWFKHENHAWKVVVSQFIGFTHIEE